MGYRHIDNLYKNQDILMLKECYAMEKIHGTSAHIAWKKPDLRFFAGGCKHSDFVALFNIEKLVVAFSVFDEPEITIFGEAYGGKMQGMSELYGKTLRFIAFEIKIKECWLSVPNAEQVARSLGFDFVHYERIPTTLEALDATRDAPSVQGNGKREGVVLRPLVELYKSNGERIIAKHKAADFCETRTPRQVDPKKLVILQEAEAIAFEWVTKMRLSHVLDAFDNVSMEQTGDIIRAMVADVEREAIGEIVESKAAKTAIGRRTAKLLKEYLNERL